MDRQGVEDAVESARISLEWVALYGSDDRWRIQHMATAIHHVLNALDELHKLHEQAERGE